MSNTSNRGDKRSTPDFDISTPGYVPKAPTHRNVILWLIVLVLAIVILYLEPAVGWMILLPIFGIALLCFVAFVAWFVIVKRGALTWMRLAFRPAKLMARGDAAAAEASYAQAIDRAKRFAPADHRRGIMLCELAMYAKNQGRYQEGLALYEESVEILSQHLASQPLDYFTVLNNYGICFIYLKDYEAAQKILEKAIDLTFAARKREANRLVRMQLQQVQMFQFVLHLNLAFLFMEMQELAEAELQLREADGLLPMLPKRTQRSWHDHYVAICALWEFESGKFAEAKSEVAQARNADYPVCLRVRAKLHMVRQEFAEAEQVLRKYQDEQRKQGTLHRPELLQPTLEFAESLYGQGKHDDTFASLQEARTIVADFALPPDAAWRKVLETWLRRARELGKPEVAASLEADLLRMPATANQAVTILEKFRIHPQTAG
jgi:tetratricopeptide (TPR) repeat protein